MEVERPASNADALSQPAESRKSQEARDEANENRDADQTEGRGKNMRTSRTSA